MNEDGKSDGAVVSAKLPNEGGPSPEEAVERRVSAQENVHRPTACRTQRRDQHAHDGLVRVREAAGRNKKERFTVLLHHVTVERLGKAFGALSRSAAPGVDGVTWDEYALDREAKLRDLHARVQPGTYRAKPSRRVMMPKPDGASGHSASQRWRTKSSSAHVLFRHTSRERMQRRLRTVREDLTCRRHLPIPVQGKWLQRVVGGYFAYHATPTNSARLAAFRREITHPWQHALGRRSQRGRVTWGRMETLTDRWIPRARILHPWPDERFDARIRGKSRVR